MSQETNGDLPVEPTAVDATSPASPAVNASAVAPTAQNSAGLLGQTPHRLGGSKLRINWNELAVTAASFVLAFIVGAILMVVSDTAILDKFRYFFNRPGDALGASWDKISTAYGALISGAVGSWQAITQTTAQAAPLICAGLGIGLTFRAGLFNIGGQGQAIMGAMVGAWVGFNFHSLPLFIHLPFAVLSGMLAGAVWASVVGLLKAKAGAHEVIVSIMMNYIGAGLLAFALTSTAFQRPGRSDPISPAVDWSATFPRLAGSQLHAGFLLALVAAFVVWWIIERTKLGFQLRAVGANPDASGTAGMSIAVVTVITMALSGALTGLAGVQTALAPMSGSTPTPLSAGLVGTIGFDAITVALLGRSKPLGIVFAGLLFGALHSGGLHMETAGTPVDLTTVLQALVVLFIGAPMLVRSILPFLKRRKRQVVKSEAVA